MRKIIVFSLFLTVVLPLRPAPVVPGADATIDLSKDKTADELWAHFETLKSQFTNEAQSGGPAAKSLVPQMQAVLKAFEAKYPKDDRAWGAKLLLIQLDRVPGGMEPGASPENDLQQLQDIAADKSAPKGIRAQASIEIINHSFPKQLNDPVGFDALDAKIAAFQKDFPDFSMDGRAPAFFRLRQEEMQLLKLTGNKDRYLALLKQLAAGSSPELAAYAQSELAQVKKIAELKTKPFELTYTAVDGTKVDIAQMRGKVVLIDFWATWCGPCVAEMPDVLAVYQKYHSQGFEIIGVSLDQDKAAMLAFTKQNGMTWPQFFDGGGFDNAISKSFDIDSIPTMWLVDKKGMLVSTEGGADLAGRVEKLLKAP